MSDIVERLKEQHLADGALLLKQPDLLAAARRALTLLKNIEVDAGEYYRETAWLEKSIAAYKHPAADTAGPTRPIDQDA